jgi:hypothetical protein
VLKRLTSAEDAEWFGRLTIQLFNLSGAAFQDPKELEQFKRLQCHWLRSSGSAGTPS